MLTPIILRGSQLVVQSLSQLRAGRQHVQCSRRIVENLWREFFADPSCWWDNREEKGNAQYPDFKHKKTQESLWLDSKLKPPWVEPMLAAITPGTLQVSTFTWNRRLARFAKAGNHKETMELFQRMLKEGINPDKFTFVPVLSACSSLRILEEGRRIHLQIIQGGHEGDVYVSSCLIDMYANCGAIKDAYIVFRKTPARNVVVWNAIILGHVKCGQGQMALDLFQQMQHERMEPSTVTYVGALNACATVGALDQGRIIHKQVIQNGWEFNLFVGSGLVDMYVKCGSIVDAEIVFNKMHTRDVVAWSAMILGHARYGQGQKALKLFQQMQQEGVEPDPMTFTGVLKACSSLVAVKEGQHIHEQIIQRGWESDVFLGSSLVDMYANCGKIQDAQRVFDKIPRRNVVVWNAIILGHVKCGQGKKALELSERMHDEGLEPSTITVVGMLNACASIGALEEGRRLHKEIARRGWESDVFVGSSLVDMYAKCGSIEDAHSVFVKVPVHDIVAWSAMILAYVKCGQGQKALELWKMRQEGVELNPVICVAVLNACASVGALEEGRRIHEYILARGWELNVLLGSSLVDMYTKCGSLLAAKGVFYKMPTRDVVAWSSIILGHVRCGEGQEALHLSRQMQAEGVEPDPFTFVAILNACANVLALEEGWRVHAEIIRGGWESDFHVGSSLIDMYTKCGNLDDAEIVFNKMTTRNVVVWNAMILGLVRCGQGQEALQLCRQMIHDNVEPNAVTFLGMLSACAGVTALEEGQRVHAHIVQRGWESDVFLGNSLIDMYAKCGSIEDAQRVFKKMSTCDVVSWNTMLAGYAMHGCALETLEHSERMCQYGIEMNEVTFISILSACSHCGLVSEGLYYFESMSSVYSIFPTVDHYTCMVDLLGRAGRVHEAEDLIKMMSCEANSSLWMSLLGACRIHGSVDLGENVAKEVRHLVPDNVTGHVLLSNIYAAAGRWESRANLQQGLQKACYGSPGADVDCGS